jgi:hypothetical protein
VIGVNGEWARPASWARRLGIDRNPMRRGLDRAEAAIRIAAVVLCLASMPMAVTTVGHWVQSATQSASGHNAPGWYPVTATVTVSVSAASAYAARSALAWAPARWSAPGGATRHGEILAPVGSRAGQKVQIWTDRAGTPRPAPLTHAQVVSRVITAMVLTPIAGVLLLGFALGVVHRILERRRSRAWESDWSAVEPLWTKRAR